ncbi:hypothetical protein V7183_10850 [Bacillus sp. JJ1127]|uniref:hypothetical protein n=1 Tax=Bacillus sp. JJ1127 TaxID=3122952 RepID=UPI002FFE29CD
MKCSKTFTALLNDSQRKQFESLTSKLQQHVVRSIYGENIRFLTVSETAYSFLTDPYQALHVYIETESNLYIVRYNKKTQEIHVGCDVPKSAISLFLNLSSNYCEEVKAQIKEAEYYRCKK